MKPHPLAPAERAPSSPGRTGSPASEFDPRLRGPLDLARRWAGADRLALIVSGSHAAGDAVWVRHEGRPVSLSDLDVYAVVRDAEAKRAAITRARDERAGLAARLGAMGLAAPLEVGFHTPFDLAALPARPGTLALRRSGRVVDGDPALRDAVPAWTPRDVPREEIWLLLENRAFELLWASRVEPSAAPPAELGALRRRHAVLKCALDLAAVMALSAGEYPEDAAARVAWARPRWRPTGSPEPPWEAALAWRRGHALPLPEAAAAAERLLTVRAWVATWRGLAGEPEDSLDPLAAVARVARRARLRRRLREALLPGAGSAHGSVPGGRIRHALDGTPRHRLHAAATAHLVFEAACAARSAEPGAAAEARRRDLEPRLQRLLRRLGAPPLGADSGSELVRAWDRGFLDGQRTEGWA